MTFSHPKYEKDCCYLIGKINIYEMQTFSDDEYCSLFVDNFVSENDKIYLINRIDLIYLLIPSLLKNRKQSQVSNKFCLSPIDQLLNHKQIKYILNKLNKKQQIDLMNNICDSQQIDDEFYYVLNDEKVINFLDLKLKQIQEKLKNNSSITINTDILSDSLSIFNEYIPNYFFEKLCKKYNLSAKRVIDPRKRKKSDIFNDENDKNHSNDNNNWNKKRRIDTNGYNHLNLNEDMNKMNVDNRSNNNNNNMIKKSATKSRAISKLSKVNTKGMKSMMSYFSAKKKK